MRVCIFRVTALIAIFLAGTPSCHSVTDYDIASSYAFHSPDSHLRLTYDMAGHTWSDGHVGEHMYNCPPDFLCLRGGALDFALPRDWQRTEHWKLKDSSFNVVGTEQLEIFGRLEPVTVIRGKLVDGADVRYFFSKQRGLLGAEIKRPAVHFTLLSESECGFAATAAACKTHH